MNHNDTLGYWEEIPPEQVPAMIDSIVNGRCIVCDAPRGDSETCYCEDCDDA